MTPERWREVTTLFHRALALEEPRRASFIADACGGDDSLRDEVAALIDAHQRAVAFGDGTVGGPGLSEPASGPAEGPRGELAAGATLGRYRIDRLVGRGGMGSVYLAFDATLQRRVALKVLDAPADEAGARARLLREARNAAALSHPGICTIHEVGEANGTAFIAMEFVEGRTLRDRLDEGRLPLEDAVRYGALAADALAYAHAHGVIHRDVKAGNAIVSGPDRLTIVDFGLARRVDGTAAEAGRSASSLVPLGIAAGTPYAMAPEQVRGEAADDRTDVWGLGVLLYEMVGGARPFAADSLAELYSSILRDPPPALGDAVPAGIAAVIARCLAKDRDHRPQARLVRDALMAPGRHALPRLGFRRRTSRWLGAATTLVLAIVAAVGLNLGGLRDRLRGASPAPPITLAVLPFENLTGDPSQEYLSDGLTDELISQLGRLQPARLHVIARTSSMRFKHSDVPLDRIGQALGVEYVVEGSARRQADRLRVTATLVRVSDQTQRWSRSFDRTLAGVVGLQTDVAEAVAGALTLTLVPDARRDASRTALVNPEAYEAYLAGRSHVMRLTRPDLDTAEQYFNLALAKDPSYALAYVGLAHVWTGRQQMQFAPTATTTPRIREAASRALALDEQLPEAHLLLGITAAWTDWDWPAAEREFTRAIELRPNYAEARAYYAHYLLIRNRRAEADEQMTRALALDPLSEFVRSFHAVSLFMAARYEESSSELRRVLETNPHSPMALAVLPQSLHYLGRLDEALDQERARWQARGDKEVEDALTAGFVAGGYAGAMRRAADLLAGRAKTQKVLCVAVANLYARAGQQDDVEMDWLEAAVDAHDPNVPYLGIAPNFAHLAAQPRFRRLLERVNLPR
jgi:serine/threonine protein kinase/Tfp pilus assembly protein PilF